MCFEGVRSSCESLKHTHWNSSLHVRRGSHGLCSLCSLCSNSLHLTATIAKINMWWHVGVELTVGYCTCP